MPVCAHTRTSDFGGPSDGGHTGLPNFRWWYPVCFANLPVCHPKQENPPSLQCSFFIENNFNICSHFIAFSRLSMNYHLDNLNISYLIRVLSHCCYSFGCLDIWIARSAKVFGGDFLDKWSYCHFLAGDDGHTGSLHEWWWWIPNFDQVMDGHYKRTPPLCAPMCNVQCTIECHIPG